MTPRTMQLLQNYPNPFNPATTIEFHLPADGMVSLRVYDLLGRVVAELANGIRMAGGHVVPFNAGHLGSGVYLMRLEHVGEVRTRKMVLMK